ncbi:MAG: alkaline phosphatase family protein, partial [Pseudomonadota bacterium]
DGHRLKVAFSVELDDAKRRAKITVGDETVEVGFREYTPWMHVPFKGVSGIARFYVQDWDEDGFGLYVTPINLDPDSPAMPLSHPFVYAIYLAKLNGPYATLGLAEDTWALNERVIDEQVFWDQAWLYYEERRRMFLDACKQVNKGLVTTVFDTTDRVQHMFMRTLDATHPANSDKEVAAWAHAIPTLYERMDALLGEVKSEWMRDDTLFLVVSDHGFTNFRRGVNLNAFLRDRGWLVLKDGARTGGEWFANVDWSRTRAYAMGLTGLFINLEGREGQGIVKPGEEYSTLVDDICAALLALRDPLDDKPAVRSAKAAMKFYTGPYRLEAPDILVGWDGGYRHSWECATGTTTEATFTDNVKAWSGDHCVDPTVVPGVIFSNRPLATDTPRLLDMAPTILTAFGQQIPKYMLGASVLPASGQAGTARGWLDPTVLAVGQSCAAPGARIHPPESEEASA